MHFLKFISETDSQALTGFFCVLFFHRHKCQYNATSLFIVSIPISKKGTLKD